MNRKKLIAVAFCLALSLSMGRRANAGGAPPADLEKADWSANAAHNLASNPPSLDAVQDFEGRSFGLSKEESEKEGVPFGDPVCKFRFADLRGSGNLSLIMSVAPGNWGCNGLYIFDRTPTGFERYSPSSGSAVGRDLAHSVLDLDHDGRHELVLWATLAPYAAGRRLGCYAEWPLIFAWTGSGYSDVSDQYKEYYRGYLKSVDARLAKYSSLLAPAAAQTANPAPMKVPAAIAEQMHAELLSRPGGEGPVGGPVPLTLAPAPKVPDWGVLNQAGQDYPCARIEAAKTEAFLGIHSDSTMSATIKDSESNDPNKRIVAAIIFSYLGTQEAEQDLKTLSNDADSRVAAVAKTAATFGEDPAPLYRSIHHY